MEIVRPEGWEAAKLEACRILCARTGMPKTLHKHHRLLLERLTQGLRARFSNKPQLPCSKNTSFLKRSRHLSNSLSREACALHMVCWGRQGDIWQDWPPDKKRRRPGMKFTAWSYPESRRLKTRWWAAVHSNSRIMKKLADSTTSARFRASCILKQEPSSSRCHCASCFRLLRQKAVHLWMCG